MLLYSVCGIAFLLAVCYGEGSELFVAYIFLGYNAACLTLDTAFNVISDFSCVCKILFMCFCTEIQIIADVCGGLLVRSIFLFLTHGFKDFIKLSDRNVPDEEISPDNIENLTYEELIKRTPIDALEVSWLGTNGEVGRSSGPNWGFRGKEGYIDQNGIYIRYNRDRNQAYIPYNVRQHKEGFFPDRKSPDEKNCPLFKAVTKNDGIFYMRMAQDNNKALHTAESNAILGKWVRKRLNVPEGSPVTLEDFKRYGKTTVTFYKYADDVFIMDF